MPRLLNNPAGLIQLLEERTSNPDAEDSISPTPRYEISFLDIYMIKRKTWGYFRKELEWTYSKNRKKAFLKHRQPIERWLSGFQFLFRSSVSFDRSSWTSKSCGWDNGISKFIFDAKIVDLKRHICSSTPSSGLVKSCGKNRPRNS